MLTRNLARCCVLALALAIAPRKGMSAEPLTSEETSRLAALDAKALQVLTNAELADYVALRNRRLASDANAPSPAAEIARYATKAKGQLFRRFATRFDWAESDCVVFVERNIALALSHDWDSFYILSERLRYKDGVVDYRNRNFSTLGDWLGDNAFILEDINGKLVGATPFTYTVRPKVFRDIPIANSKFKRTQFLGSDYKSGQKEVRNDKLVRSSRIAGALKDLRTGDIFLAISNVPRDPGCEHLGIVVRGDNGSISVVHSAAPKVREEPITTFLERCFWIDGLKILRLRSDAGKLADAEVARLRPSIKVPLPSKQDDAVKARRAARTKAAKTNP